MKKIERSAAIHEKQDQSGQSPAVPESRHDLLILQSIRRIMRAVDIHSRKLRSQYELTTPQLVCLQSVVGQGPLTVKEVASRVYLSPSTIVGILDRLEGRGLIKRERDTKDRRVMNIAATTAGKRMARKVPSALQDGLHEALKRLPKLEQATIALSLKRVVDLMEVGHIDAAPILETAPIESKDKK